MKTDTLRLIFTYIIALAVVVGGGLTIWLTANDPSATDLRILIGGFIGATLQFVYGGEVQTRTGKQAEASTASAVAAVQTNGHTRS